MSDITVVIKSSWFSKINWTQAVAFLGMIFTMFGIDVPEDVKAAIVSAIVAISTVITWVLRTFFTTSITPSSAKKA